VQFYIPLPDADFQFVKDVAFALSRQLAIMFSAWRNPDLAPSQLQQDPPDTIWGKGGSYGRAACRVHVPDTAAARAAILQAVDPQTAKVVLPCGVKVPLQFDDRPFVSVISSGWPVNTQQQQVWDLLEENDFTVVHVSRFQRQGLGFPDKGRFLVTAVLPKHGLDVLDVCNPGQQQRPMYSIRFEPLEAPRARSATGPWATQQQQQQWWEQQHMEQQAMLQRLFMWQPQQQQRGTAPAPPVQPAGAGVGFAPIPAGQLVAPQQQPPLVVQLHQQQQQQQPQPPLQQQQQQQQQQQVVSPGWPALPAPLPPWQPPPGFVPPMQPTAHAAVVVPSAAAVAISSTPATSASPMDVEDASSHVPAQQQQQQLAAEPDAMDVQQSLLESAPVGTMGQQQQPAGSTVGPTHGSAPGQLQQQQQLQQPPPQQVPDLSEAPTTAAAAAPNPAAAATAVAVGSMAANHYQQQQQQLQPTSNPIPRLPAVAYAVLAVLPALASAFYTPSQLQQQAGSSHGSEEDAFYLWPLLRAPGASIWGHHLRQLVGVARGVEEDWDPGDVNADGQQPLPLADAEALGPAFFAAFQHLVYAGPPEDRLGSVPGEVVAWVRAWLQQRGYRLYRGYE
jgi:hypothetical protein